MNIKKEKFLWVCLLALVLIIGSISLNGCKKSEPAASDTSSEKAPEAASVTIEQTTCPIMDGNPINKNIFTEYKGQKVYFCCTGCEDKFKADPEKYISKLPQFQK